MLRIRFDPASGAVSGAPERIITGLPDGGNHWTRTVHVGPDDKLYVTVGSSCNVCIEDDRRRAAMLRYDLDGSGEELYATGLRNAVDFAWQPGTGASLRHRQRPRSARRRLSALRAQPHRARAASTAGRSPTATACPIPTTAPVTRREIAASIPPAHGFGAHTAPLGITFYAAPAGNAPAAFPPAYAGAAFVAQHGSWNRSKKSGYQVVALHFRADGTITEEPFATGFMIDEKVSGRPVDVAVGPDGALYVSDDFTGAIYRIAYGAAGGIGSDAAGACARARSARRPQRRADHSRQRARRGAVEGQRLRLMPRRRAGRAERLSPAHWPSPANTRSTR